MANNKPIGVAYSDPELVALTVSGSSTSTTGDTGAVSFTRSVVGGDTGVGAQFTTNALAGAPVRQGAINVAMTRASGQDVTWDGNPDCGIKIAARNYAANTANNGAARGIDVSARNSGTNISWVNAANFGARNDSGKTAYQLQGVTVRLENYGTLETDAIGLDVNMSIENDTGSPVKYGIRVRNTDASGMGAVDAVIAVSNTSTNGFGALFDLDGIAAGADTTLYSTSGTAATTFAGRIRIVMPNGNSGWLNVYSTSNA